MCCQFGGLFGFDFFSEGCICRTYIVGCDSRRTDVLHEKWLYRNVVPGLGSISSVRSRDKIEQMKCCHDSRSLEWRSSAIKEIVESSCGTKLQ